MTTVLDLPAFNIVPPFGAPDGPDADFLSVAGDGHTVTFTTDSQPLDVGNFGDGPGAPGVFTSSPPDIFPPSGAPDWSLLIGAAYVVNAVASATAPATGSWSGFTPPPTMLPTLYLDYTGAPDELTLDPIPTSAADVVSADDPNTISTMLGRVRLWMAGPTVGSITVDYLALRLTYSDAPSSDSSSVSQVLAPLRILPRTDGLGAGPARRIYPPPRSIQGSNRPTGYL